MPESAGASVPEFDLRKLLSGLYPRCGVLDRMVVVSNKKAFIDAFERGQIGRLLVEGELTEREQTVLSILNVHAYAQAKASYEKSGRITEQTISILGISFSRAGVSASLSPAILAAILVRDATSSDPDDRQAAMDAIMASNPEWGCGATGIATDSTEYSMLETATPFASATDLGSEASSGAASGGGVRARGGAAGAAGSGEGDEGAFRP